MVWKTLAESLESALASMMEGRGEESAPSACNVLKEPASTEVPAAVRQEVVPNEGTALLTQEGQVSRKQRIAPGSPSPAVASPKPAMRCFLVIEGGKGGGPASGGGVRPSRRRDAGGNAREFVKLVHSALSS